MRLIIRLARKGSTTVNLESAVGLVPAYAGGDSRLMAASLAPQGREPSPLTVRPVPRVIPSTEAPTEVAHSLTFPAEPAHMERQDLPEPSPPHSAWPTGALANEASAAALTAAAPPVEAAPTQAVPTQAAPTQATLPESLPSELPAAGLAPKEKLRCKYCGSIDVWRFGRVSAWQVIVANAMGGQWISCRRCRKRFVSRYYGRFRERGEED